MDSSTASTFAVERQQTRQLHMLLAQRSRLNNGCSHGSKVIVTQPHLLTVSHGCIICAAIPWRQPEYARPSNPTMQMQRGIVASWLSHSKAGCKQSKFYNVASTSRGASTRQKHWSCVLRPRHSTAFLLFANSSARTEKKSFNRHRVTKWLFLIVVYVY